MLRHFDSEVIHVLARCARLNCQPRTVTRGMVTKGILAQYARLNCQPRCVGQYRCLDLKFELVPPGNDAASLRLCDRLKLREMRVYF